MEHFFIFYPPIFLCAFMLHVYQISRHSSANLLRDEYLLSDFPVEYAQIRVTIDVSDGNLQRIAPIADQLLLFALLQSFD